MQKMKMNRGRDLTLHDGIQEYLVDCRGRNLREGTIKHYRDSSKQIEKYIGADLKKLLKKPKVTTCSFTEYKSWVSTNFLLSTGTQNRKMQQITKIYSNVPLIY